MIFLYDFTSYNRSIGRSLTCYLFLKKKKEKKKKKSERTHVDW